jgi:site-specific DNA recombinase
VVDSGKVEMQISLKLLAAEIPGPASNVSVESDVLTIPVEAHLSRQGGEISFVFPAGSNQTKSRSAPALIRAVARAHNWVDRILRGETLNQRAIAEELQVDERYISRIIPLAFLAPDLTEEILQGNHATHLSLRTFPAAVPADWAEQRAWLRNRNTAIEAEESDLSSKDPNHAPYRGNTGQLELTEHAGT